MLQRFVAKATFKKGNQWVFIVPDHKAGYFLGFYGGIGGVPLDSHDVGLSKLRALHLNRWSW